MNVSVRAPAPGAVPCKTIGAAGFGRACAIVGAYLWGLAANGKEGCQRVLEILENEIISAMGLMGVTSIDQLNPKYVCRAEPVMPAPPLAPWTDLPEALLTAGLDNGAYLFTRATGDGSIRARAGVAVTGDDVMVLNAGEVPARSA